MRFIFILLPFLFVFHNLPAGQEMVFLNGSVRHIIDEQNDQYISNARITITRTGYSSSALTDSLGYYLFSNIQPGIYDIKIEATGFQQNEKRNVDVKPGYNTINFFVEEDSYVLEEVDVIGERFRRSADDIRGSLINLPPKTSKILPGAGEDVLRSLQSLPGITSPNDFSSQLVVRGSGPDQNLIVMDDVEIFNPYRLYGVFSMFNPETLSDINLVTGAFQSKYGDRLSAVLDVSNREGTRAKNFTGSTNINIANANLVFSGKLPIKNIPGSWLISTRRTYYDLILKPFAKSAGLIDESASFPAFEDIQGKLVFGPFGSHKFIVNGIYSKDGVNIVPGESKEMQDSISIRDVTNNDVIGLAWHYAPSDKFLTRSTVSWYRNQGDANFQGQLLDPVVDKEIYDPELRDSLRAIGLYLGVGFKTKYIFRKYSVSNNTIFYTDNQKIEIGGGMDIMKTDLSFKLDMDERFKAIISGNPNFTAISESLIEGKNYWRMNLYAQNRITAAKNLFIQPGVRIDYFDIINKAYAAPRLNISYGIDDLTTVRFGTGLYYQSPGYEKLIDAQVFYDLTPEKTRQLEAEKSYHFVLGIDRYLTNEVNVKVEGYFKKFEDLVVQEKLIGYRYQFTLNDPNNQDPNYMRNPANWTKSDIKYPYDSLTASPVNGATGRSYGVEFFIEKRAIDPKSKLSGWVSYSLSWANRQRDGLTTPFKFDQRHNLNIVVNYRLLKWLEVGGKFNYASNFPMTRPVGIKPRTYSDSLAVLPILNIVQFDFDFGDESNRLAFRKPAYHRLDIRATAYTRFWNVDWAFYLDVINVYNNKNVIGYDWYLDENLKLGENAIGQFPILPTIGINARF